MAVNMLDGRVPMLVDHGFTGRVWGHAATLDIAMLIMEDTAKIAAHADGPPIYDRDAVERTRARLMRHPGYGKRQVIGPFTVDFLCREAGLVVEVDGATHSEDHDRDYDTRRTAYLGLKGYRVLRILNDDVFHRINDVMDMILLALADELPPD